MIWQLNTTYRGFQHIIPIIIDYSQRRVISCILDYRSRISSPSRALFGIYSLTEIAISLLEDHSAIAVEKWGSCNGRIFKNTMFQGLWGSRGLGRLNRLRIRGNRRKTARTIKSAQRKADQTYLESLVVADAEESALCVAHSRRLCKGVCFSCGWYFESFSNSHHNSSKPSTKNYQRLRKSNDWKRDDSKREKAWVKFRLTLIKRNPIDDFEINSNDLFARQTLCIRIGMRERLATCDGCVQVWLM